MPRYVADGEPYGSAPRPQLSIELTTDGGRFVLRAHGEVDLATALVLETALSAVTAGEAESIVIDLAGVRFMDATGLGVLLRGYSRARARGTAFTVVNLQPIPRLVLEVTGVLKLLTFDDNT